VQRERVDPVTPVSLQMHVRSPQRCRRLTGGGDVRERSRHVDAFGRRGRKRRRQEALPANGGEPGGLFHQGSDRTSAGGRGGPGSRVHRVGLLPRGPAPDAQPGPDRAGLRPELRAPRGAAVARSGPQGRPHKLIRIRRHQRLAVPRQRLMTHFTRVLSRLTDVVCVINY